MGTAYLLLGSNIGDRTSYLAQACILIEQKCGHIVHQSALYETAPWGLLEQEPFLNQAIALETHLSPQQLMKTLLEIEEIMGRKRTIKYGPRMIDLDILLFDAFIINTSLLILPHPALPDRRFALTPLAEIAPLLIHPTQKKTIQQLLTNCKDDSNVQKKLT